MTVMCFFRFITSVLKTAKPRPFTTRPLEPWWRQCRPECTWRAGAELSPAQWLAMQSCMRDAERLKYFHGLLPREDIPELLRKNGDFIVRLSEKDDKKKEGGRQDKILIISLFIHPVPPGHKKEPGSDGMFKHYVFNEAKEKGKVTVDGGEHVYDSAHDLVEFHMMNRQPLRSNFEQGLLINPIKRQHWELLHEDITVGTKLGEGAFGEVASGKLRLNKKKTVDVAIKIAKATEMNKEKIKEVMKEARLMRNFKHHHVVRLYGVAVIKEPLMIVMELVTGGALDDYLKKNSVSMDGKIDMVMGAAWGVEYLHRMNVIHRDLAARNCLFNNGVCKISDFGLTREGTEYVMKVVTKLPIRWLSPEVITQFKYSRESDVWAFGILVWEIMHDASEPYTGKTFAEVKNFILKAGRMEFRPDCDRQLIKIIMELCWANSPEKRPSMDKVVKQMENWSGRVFIPPTDDEEARSDDNKSCDGEARGKKPRELQDSGERHLRKSGPGVVKKSGASKRRSQVRR